MSEISWRHMNEIPHGGPASWKRAALTKMAQSTGTLLARGAMKCLAVFSIAYMIIDPAGAIEGVFGGAVEMGDGTVAGTLNANIDRKVNELQSISDPVEYKTRLQSIRSDYIYLNTLPDGGVWMFNHVIQLIDQQLEILNQ